MDFVSTFNRGKVVSPGFSELINISGWFPKVCEDHGEWSVFALSGRAEASLTEFGIDLAGVCLISLFSDILQEGLVLMSQGSFELSLYFLVLGFVLDVACLASQ